MSSRTLLLGSAALPTQAIFPRFVHNYNQTDHTSLLRSESQYHHHKNVDGHRLAPSQQHSAHHYHESTSQSYISVGDRLAGASFEKRSASLGCDENVNSYSGYFKLGASHKRYFYWFFESRSQPTQDPTFLWLTGGPGCSSMVALFTENGPCSVHANGRDLIRNKYSWTNNANAIFVDQPFGTGFSKSDAPTHRHKQRHGNSYSFLERNIAPQDPHVEERVAGDMYLFLQAFFADPTFKKFNRNFYIIGESYAGHYIPAISAFMVSKQKQQCASDSSCVTIDLKGVGIGNGWTDPATQYGQYVNMVEDAGLVGKHISHTQHAAMRSAVPVCMDKIKRCNERVDKEGPAARGTCILATEYCEDKLLMPYINTNLNPYDHRIRCEIEPLC